MPQDCWTLGTLGLLRPRKGIEVLLESLAILRGEIESMQEDEEEASVHSNPTLEAAEREIFARAIVQAQGNQAKAARWLGVSRVTMKAKLLQFGLHPAQGAEDDHAPTD